MRLTDEEIMKLKLENKNMELHLKYVKNLEKGVKKISEILKRDTPEIYKLNGITDVIEKLEEII